MTSGPALVIQGNGDAVLDRPVRCLAPLYPENPVSPACAGDAFGPYDRPRCADHGGPDLYACERCERTIADDAEQFDCTRYSGPIHAACHPDDCRSIDCAEALTDPEPYDWNED